MLKLLLVLSLAFVILSAGMEMGGNTEMFQRLVEVLAVMSSSSSGIVTPFVCPSFTLFSIKVENDIIGGN